MRIKDKIQGGVFMFYKKRGNFFITDNQYQVYDGREIKLIDGEYAQLVGDSSIYVRLLDIKVLGSVQGKLLGYKIKDEAQEDAIIAYVNKRWNSNATKGNNVDGTWLSISNAQKYKSANLLDLWFEPVYQQLLNVKKGDYLYRIKSVIIISGLVETNRGLVYLSEVDNRFTNNSGEKDHHIGPEFATEHFRLATFDEITESKKLKIEGYEAEFSKTGVAFGCTEISKKTLQYFCDLQKSMKKRDINLPGFQVTKVGFSYNGKDVTKQVAEVFKHFKIK